MQEPTYHGFTDNEWIVIDNALEALLTELEEMADPEFSVALENVVYAYDLDEHMEKEVVDQYDDHCNTQYSDFQ